MKTFLATFVGVIVAMILMMGIQMLGHTLFPVPFEVNPNEPEKMVENMHLIPLGALIVVIMAHGLGLLGGLITARMIDKKTTFPVYIIVGFLMLGTVANLAMIPHPVWFAIADVTVMILVALPFILRKRK